MHEVLPATCIIRDARTLYQHRRQYAPLRSTRSPLTILSQSSPWAMHEEHHGKNAQELICKTPTHSASINGVAPHMGFTRILAGASLRGLPYTSHVVTVKKNQRLQSNRHPAAEIKAQPKNAANHHIFHTGHQKIMQQMHSTEEEPCPQTRNAQTQTGLGEAALEKPQSTTEELAGAAPKAIPCECK
ncbi:hypothetical protein TcG_12751 [Trypanosoma cruzi]|nr:hypothetical protein TcG_12751 [Trypanosoma cruzi]